ncbi:MAG: hypothetical protein V2I63_01480 [Pseudomonadales bacterium]|jgi:hypothetical protein|nr:hypothetical protein [Pseudomonadales bacterium]
MARRTGLTIRFRRLAPALLLCCAGVTSSVTADPLLWRSMDWFEGRWDGTEEGVSGKGRTARCVSTLFSGRFRFHWSVFELSPQPKSPEGARHERWQILGRKPDTDLIVLEQFDSAGYRSEFRLDPAQSRADRFVFRAVELDSAPEGMDARVVWAVTGGDSFRETLELGPVDGDLEPVSTLRWRRVSNAIVDCTGPAPEIGRAY